MKLLDKAVNLVGKETIVQKVNRELGNHGLNAIKSRSSLYAKINRKRRLTDEEDIIKAVLGKGSRELWVNWPEYEKLEKENKDLKYRILDLSPKLFSFSWRTHLLATLNFTILLLFIIGGIVAYRNLDKYLDLQIQKYYSKEILELEQEKNEALLRTERAVNEMISTALDETKAQVRDLTKKLDDSNKENEKIQEKLREVKPR